LAFKVMLGLTVLSFPIPYFWCRYLCPYGAVCPEKNAIRFLLPPVRSSFRHALPGIVIAVLFVTGIAAARLSGNWHNTIPKEAYLAHVNRPPSVQIGGHPGPAGRAGELRIQHSGPGRTAHPV